MSELVPFESAPLPSYLSNVEIDDVTKSIAGVMSNRRISVEGSVFRYMVDGKEVGKTDARAINVVIVNAARKVSRQYYAGTYVRGENKAPDCWSSDGERPDSSIKSPQSNLCVNCPQNQAGSGQGDSRACRFQRRIAVVLDGAMDKEIYQMTLAATSIFGKAENGKMPFGAYAQFLVARGTNIGHVVTEMRFDTDASVPKIVFKPIRHLTEEEFHICAAQKESPDALSAITMTVTQRDTSNEAKAQPAKAALTAPAAKASTAKAATAKVAADTSAPEAESVPSVKTDKSAAPAPKKDIQAALAVWASDTDDDDDA